MTETPLWQVDAFTNRPFSGNPAAVCWLKSPAEESWMQAVAAEMNLSETAFVAPHEQGLSLRWFTPQVEVALCGHATLAAAHALWEAGLYPDDQPLKFQTLSGQLTCTRQGEWIELDFPATPVTASPAPEGLLEALGVEALFVGTTKFDYLVEIAEAETLRQMQPDFRLLAQIPTRGIIVTAVDKTREYDFLSRLFAPVVGVNEDPVTGSTHCSLGPYWGEKLGKQQLLAYQASSRGGVLRVRLADDRIILGGQAVTVLEGKLR